MALYYRVRCAGATTALGRQNIFGGRRQMATTVNAGARLDRLPISPFHYRVFWLIGAGMFFDGYDLYVGASVLGAAVQSGFSTLGLNAWFVSLTFLGMTVRS